MVMLRVYCAGSVSYFLEAVRSSLVSLVFRTNTLSFISLRHLQLSIRTQHTAFNTAF